MKVGTDSMLLGSLVSTGGSMRALDIGAGTGVLSLMIAQRNPETQVDAVEIDPEAAEECAINFKCSDWSDRLKVYTTDIARFTTSDKYDLIICNPPYFRSRNENQSEKEARARHERFMPLEVLYERVTELLSQNGSFFVILPSEDEPVWMEIFSNTLFLHSAINIAGKLGDAPKRVILEFKKEPGLQKRSLFSVRTSTGEYTEEYKELTREFHATPL